jgi:hypothetical protein
MRRLLLLCLLLLPASRAFASCGSASCPLDLNALNRPMPGRFTLDLSFEYIDQDRPMIGRRGAAVGELATHHDEVRTVNRRAALQLQYAPSDRLQFSATMPWISRSHDHLASNHHHGRPVAVDHNVIPQHWNATGNGDLLFQARTRIAGALWATAGVEVPTGADDVSNGNGEVAEMTIQPGSGGTDVLLGLAYERGRYFTSATYRRNAEAHDYRFGDEWLLNAGTSIPLLARTELLLQANARIRGRDEEAGVRDAFTGGSAIYATPGVRVNVGRYAVYGLLQVPLYQRVNGLQLTANRNFVTGVQARF